MKNGIGVMSFLFQFVKSIMCFIDQCFPGRQRVQQSSELHFTSAGSPQSAQRSSKTPFCFCSQISSGIFPMKSLPSKYKTLRNGILENPLGIVPVKRLLWRSWTYITISISKSVISCSSCGLLFWHLKTLPFQVPHVVMATLLFLLPNWALMLVWLIFKNPSFIHVMCADAPLSAIHTNFPQNVSTFLIQLIHDLFYPWI